MVPEHIRDHIDIILPTVNFDAKVIPRDTNGLVARQNHKGANIHSYAKTNGKQINLHNIHTLGSNADVSTCDQIITPDCLRALYNFSYTPVATDRNSYGIGKPYYIKLMTSSDNHPGLLVEYTPQGRVYLLHSLDNSNSLL